MGEKKSFAILMVIIISAAIIPGVTAIDATISGEAEANAQTISTERKANVKKVDTLVADNKANVRTMRLKYDLELNSLKTTHDKVIKDQQTAVDNEILTAQNIVVDADNKNFDMYGKLYELDALDQYCAQMVSDDDMNITAANSTIRRWMWDNYDYPTTIYTKSLFNIKAEVSVLIYENQSAGENDFQYREDIVIAKSVDDRFTDVWNFAHTDGILKEVYNGDTSAPSYNADEDSYHYADLINGLYFYIEFNTSLMYDLTDAFEKDQDVLLANLTAAKNLEWQARYNLTQLWIGANETTYVLAENNMSTSLESATAAKEKSMVTDLENSKKLISASIALFGFSVTLFTMSGDILSRKKEEDEGGADAADSEEKKDEKKDSEEEPVKPVTKAELLKAKVAPLVGILLLLIGLTIVGLGAVIYTDYKAWTSLGINVFNMV
jgi:hypothetical protein